MDDILFMKIGLYKTHNSITINTLHVCSAHTLYTQCIGIIYTTGWAHLDIYCSTSSTLLQLIDF